MKKIVLILSFVAISSTFFCYANTPYKQAQEMCAEENKRAKRTTEERSTIRINTNSYDEKLGGQNNFKARVEAEGEAKLKKRINASGSAGGSYERLGERENSGSNSTTTEYFECE